MATNAKFYTAIFLAALLMNSSACSFKKDGAENEKEKTATATAEEVANELERIKQEGLKKQTLAAKDFVFEVQEGKAPNQYFVSISYPTVEGVVVYISQGNVIPNSYSGMKIETVGGKTLNFDIVAYNSAGVMVLNTSKEVIVPLDLVISELYPLNKDTTLVLGRLYLNDESTLQTNGFLLSIEANKIFARPKSRIINYNAGEILTKDSQKSGGSITLRAKHASGFLSINLNGLNGKNGHSSVDQDFRTSIWPAADGDDGQPGESDGDGDCSDDGNGGGRCGVINIRCLKQPTNGENGEKGEDGATGGNGMSGGDTGNLFVQIEEHESFALKVALKPGKGGKGGEGGQGKPGGKGGAPGAMDRYKVCKPAVKGQDGDHGGPGKPGSDGSAGGFGTVELNGLKNALVEKFNPEP
ncbi:hypothetical protein [Bdellovibrio sp. HCB274]|uniref:hypothetical protein n=1 Tax=Bdellovibrio sp. HCB274 TaxID=3394361 RepID=UPI0039B5094E